MERATREVQLGDNAYKMTLLGHDESWATLDKVKGPLGKLFSAMTDDESGGAALIAACIDALSGPMVLDLVRTFGRYTTVIGVDNVEIRLDNKNKVASHFQGNMGEEVAFVAHSIIFNYESFMQARGYMSDIFQPLASLEQS